MIIPIRRQFLFDWKLDSFREERLLALYLNVNGAIKLVINKLFPQRTGFGSRNGGNDVEDSVEILSEFVEHDKTYWHFD